MVDVIIARLFGALIFGTLMALGFGSCGAVHEPSATHEPTDTVETQEIFTYLDTATCRAPWTLHD